jgi:ABC-type xylose transport system permease subunit
MALPVIFIVEYSGWLWWYGHELNEMGAFTVKPFMPTVFGQGKVAQFTTHSYPAIGFGLMLVSSILLALAFLMRRKQAKLDSATASS